MMLMRIFSVWRFVSAVECARALSLVPTFEPPVMQMGGSEGRGGSEGGESLERKQEESEEAGEGEGEGAGERNRERVKTRERERGRRERERVKRRGREREKKRERERVKKRDLRADVPALLPRPPALSPPPFEL